MKLKTIKKTIYEVDSYDLEKFIESIYGGSPEIPAIEEKGNDSQFSVGHIPSAYKLREKEVDSKIRKGKYPMYSTSEIMECLYEDGHIEEGEYIIKISW